MNTYQIKKISLVVNPKSIEDVMSRIGESVIESITISHILDELPQFPITKIGTIQAESIEDALTKLDQIQVETIKIDQQNISKNWQTILKEFPDGVGTELHKLLEKIGFTPKPNCKCWQHIVEMNQKGIEWCESNIDTIINWLKEEAKRQDGKFGTMAAKIGARILVNKAITNAKKTV